MSNNEAALIERARRLEAGAWTEIYNQFYPRIYGFLVVRVHDSTLAEDLAADVFVKALRGIQTYEDRGIGLAAWLYRIAQNRIADHFRHPASRLNETLDDISERVDFSDEQTRALLHSERIDLNAALKQLNPEQQQIIYLRFIEGLSSQQVAVIMNKSEATVKITQHRALKALKHHLTQDLRTR